MRVSTKRIVFVLIALVALIASVVVYSFFISPEYKTIMDLRGTSASKQNRFETYSKTLESVKNFSSSLSGGQGAQSQASLILPLGPDASYFANQLIGIAKQSGATIDSVGIQSATPQSSNSAIIKNVGKLRAEIHVTGTYTQMKNFIKGIEGNALLMDVANMEIGGISSQNTSLSGTFSIMSYYQAAQ